MKNVCYLSALVVKSKYTQKIEDKYIKIMLKGVSPDVCRKDMLAFLRHRPVNPRVVDLGDQQHARLKPPTRTILWTLGLMLEH